MAERPTAEERLERLLYVLPAAHREGGAPLAELARTLGVEETTILEDLAEVTARDLYHPPGAAEDLKIYVEADRVGVWTAGQFRRPVRLTDREALCLGVALRAAALRAGAADDATDAAAAGAAPAATREHLRRRLESALAGPSPRTPGENSTDAPDLSSRFAAPALEDDPDAVRETVLAAAGERRRCRITYLKPGAGAPEERALDPYTVAHAQGAWYVIGHCHLAGGVRIFRLDRTLRVELLEEGFDPPASYDPARYLEGGRVFAAGGVPQAVVRYSARVARWLEEREPVERAPDGSVLVRHTVADPVWLVRHVLRYGPDAEVLEPPDLRALVREAAERVAGPG